MAQLILASTSRYRLQLLGRLGLPLETQDPEVDERKHAGEEASALAARLANAKASNVADRVDSTDAIIVGADQAAALDGELLRKPGDPTTALRQLTACQGKVVSFHTACTVIDQRSGRRLQGMDHTRVSFLTLDGRCLERYIEIEQPFDCAGGFKAEGLGIALFDSIESSDPTALLGLPLIWLSRALRDLAVDPFDPQADG
jgi:septum formation protein